MIALWTPEIDVTLDRFPDRALMLIGRQAGLQLQNAHLLTIERQRTQERAQLSRVISAANDMRDLPIALRRSPGARRESAGSIVRVFTREAISASLTITAIAGDDRDDIATLRATNSLESLPLAAHAADQTLTDTHRFFRRCTGNVTPADHDADDRGANDRDADARRRELVGVSSVPRWMPKRFNSKRRFWLKRSRRRRVWLCRTPDWRCIASRRNRRTLAGEHCGCSRQWRHRSSRARRDRVNCARTSRECSARGRYRTPAGRR